MKHAVKVVKGAQEAKLAQLAKCELLRIEQCATTTTTPPSPAPKRRRLGSRWVWRRCPVAVGLFLLLLLLLLGFSACSGHRWQLRQDDVL